jgi:hypothetical protein
MCPVPHGPYGRRTWQSRVCSYTDALKHAHTIIAHTQPYAIRDKTATIYKQLLRQVFDNFAKRLRKRVANEGDNVQDVIWEK